VDCGGCRWRPQGSGVGRSSRSAYTSADVMVFRRRYAQFLIEGRVDVVVAAEAAVVAFVEHAQRCLSPAPSSTDAALLAGQSATTSAPRAPRYDHATPRSQPRNKSSWSTGTSARCPSAR